MYVHTYCNCLCAVHHVLCLMCVKVYTYTMQVEPVSGVVPAHGHTTVADIVL